MDKNNIKMAGSKTRTDHLLQIKNIIDELPNIFSQNNKEPVTLMDMYTNIAKKYHTDFRVFSVVIDTFVVTGTNINGKKIYVKSFQGGYIKNSVGGING